MLRLLSMVLLMAATAFAAPLSAIGQTLPKAMGLSPVDQADIARVESYLNGFSSLKARFQQFAPDGSLSEGTLYLKRPGQMRFEYDEPSPILIVADGSFVIFHDKSVNQIDRVPINSTPLGVLLDDRIRLRDSRVRISRIDRNPGALRVTVFDVDRPKEGEITLAFSDAPLSFRGWQVRDASGQVTSIALSKIETGLSFPGKLFTFIDPPNVRPRSP